jgi:glutamine cyclotransferase
MLVASDGTETLRVLDPESLEVERVMRVLDGDVPVSSLNELEFVRGEIFANVWKADKIVRIDPGSGRVLGWIDLRSLRREVEWSPLLDVLNGIAWNPRQDRLYVTGKNWSKVFEIELVRE